MGTLLRQGFLVALTAAAAACASTVDGGAWALDGALPDVAPGLNPDGLDPFRPTDAGVIAVDGAEDSGVFQIPDGGSVLDDRYGYVWIGTNGSAGSASSYVSAEFRYVSRPEDPRCTYVSASNWDVISCDTQGAPVPDRHPTPFPNAGVISVTGGLQPVSLRPSSTGTYSGFTTSGPSFAGPRQVTVRAAGSAAVPAFTYTASVPAALELTSPSLDGSVLTFSPNEDLVLTWRPVEARSISVSLGFSGTLDRRPRSVRVYGEFSGAAGRGVIPRRALRDLARLAGGADGSFFAVPQNYVATRVGSWPLLISAAGMSVSVVARLR